MNILKSSGFYPHFYEMLNDLDNSLESPSADDPISTRETDSYMSIEEEVSLSVEHEMSASSKYFSVKTLMEKYNQWLTKGVSTESNLFLKNFKVEEFVKLLQLYIENFNIPCDYDQNFGFVQKIEVGSFEHPQIYVRADLHGDLKSLMENLKVLQQNKLMGENYDCMPGVHLVFLGDYCDRGTYGTEILTLLMQLHLENPDQVHLIRGNHEDLAINLAYSRSDKNLQKIVLTQSTAKLLNSFYQTMPLSLYFGVDHERKEYVQFTHGLFELTFDPSSLLDSPEFESFKFVPKKREFSERVKNMALTPAHPLNSSAKKIMDIFSKIKLTKTEEDSTFFNWADVSINQESSYLSFAARQFFLNGEEIYNYLNLCSDRHSVKLIYRGHQHIFSETLFNEQVIATTLTVGVDSTYTSNQFDKAYILQLAPKVADWKKKSIIRLKNANESAVYQEISVYQRD